jgi:3-methylfumaryl-CoA hydratase
VNDRVDTTDVCVIDRTVEVDAVDLFMFSAACSLAHRIHYDADFARSEALAGTPVHGPMQAAWLSQLVSEWARERGGWLSHLTVRNTSPAYPGTLTCSARGESVEVIDGYTVYRIAVHVQDSAGVITSVGSAQVTVMKAQA